MKEIEHVDKIFKILNRELEEKNKQIAEFQSIAHAHNRQLENLNETIQLSNQTIQQLNNILALPQVKDVVQTMQEPGHRLISALGRRRHNCSQPMGI